MLKGYNYCTFTLYTIIALKKKKKGVPVYMHVGLCIRDVELPAHINDLFYIMFLSKMYFSLVLYLYL